MANEQFSARQNSATNMIWYRKEKKTSLPHFGEPQPKKPQFTKT
jgi:hypothetical protein